MKYDILDIQLDSKSISDNLKNADSDEERQLIMLTVIRNNLNTIKGQLESIKGWVTFMGILVIVSLILSLFI